MLIIFRAESVNLYPLVPSIFVVFFIFYQRIKYQLLNMLKIKREINQKYFEIIYLQFVKTE